MWKPHGEPSSSAFTRQKRSIVPTCFLTVRRQRFVGRVMKLKLDGSKRSIPHHYLRWTFLGTVAVMIVGLIGVGLSFMD